MEQDSIMGQPDVMAQMQVLQTFQSLAPLLDASLKLAPNPKDSKRQTQPEWQGRRLSRRYRS